MYPRQGLDWFRPVVPRRVEPDWFRLVVLAVAGGLTGFRLEHFNYKEKSWSGFPNIVTTYVCKSAIFTEFLTIETEQKLLRNSGCC